MELLQLENIILTYLKVKVPNVTEHKYPNMSFTNEVSDKTPAFPNVYVHELEPSEVGNSIPNQTIHAVRETIQIDVSTNVSKSDAKIVSNACIYVLKDLHFSLITDVYTKVNNIHTYQIRMRRVIANGDTF